MQTKLAASARWVLIFSAVGLAALLLSFLPLGDLRIAFGGIAYLAAQCATSFGYIYASATWRIPRLHYLGLLPPLLLGIIYAAVRLLGPRQDDTLGIVLWLAWWAICMLIGFIVLVAVAGWFALLKATSSGSQTNS